MDWKYILSLSPDDLNEEEKDELFNTITWFDTDSFEVNLKKYNALFKISQELLKYKGEQVETLLHELDEIATRQGEEEARKIDSESDGRSSKSHISSSIVLENLEQKYLELKSKYKKQIKLNENNKTELEKLKKQNVKLNQEKKQLQHELQVANQDGSQSDTTESFKEQHRELVETVHNKNKQISDLLRDIEEVEKENFVLREKVTDLRDNLANATKELATLTQSIKSIKIEVEEKDDTIQSLTKEVDSLTSEVKDACDQKQQVEEQLDEFTQEVNSRIDDWKKLLDEKDEEIENLKSKQINKSVSSSPSKKSIEHQKTHVSALNKVLNQREQQILDVQIQLQDATNEMNKTTAILQKLKEEKVEDKKKLVEYSSSIKDLKKQLKASHLRCQQLQEQTIYHEKIIQDKKDDLNNIIQKLKEDGQLDVSDYVNEVQEIKALTRMREKQITNLVKTTNKLQETVDHFEKENEVLRDTLGLGDTEVSTHGYVTKKQHEKELQEKKMRAIKNKLNAMDEEKLQLKSEIHKQNQTISRLSNQLMNLGEKPATLNDTQDTTYSYHVLDNLTKEQIKALSEENEALRKGMHEILESLNIKRESSLKEIKSETFESLLRALDVKHMAGWYHPAMRLQAELHNVQGNNEELREQLRLIKLELESHKNKEIIHEVDGDQTKQEKLEETGKLEVTTDFNELKFSSFEEAVNTLELLIIEIEKQYKHLDKDFEKYKTNFKVIATELYKFISIHNKEKDSLIEANNALKSDVDKTQQDNEILETKLATLLENDSEESQKQKLLKEVSNNIISNRKITYLESENRRTAAVILNMNNDSLNMKTENIRKLKDLTASNKTLKNQLEVLQGNYALSVDKDKYTELEKNLNNMTIKYRELLKEFKHINDAKEFEINLLKESEQQLKQHKSELLTKIETLLSKIYQNGEDSTIDDRLEVLSKKLAECEVNEISEKQRANHTNNLYELVKEQLQKSEERFKEFEKYNKEILRKNLVLQEHLIELENKLINFIDHDTFSKVQKECNNALERNTALEGEISKLQKDYLILDENFKSQKLWKDSQEQQLLHLRHQIVDLQSVSDEKTVIAQLSSDIIQARLNETDCKTKLDNLRKELNESRQECEKSVAYAEKLILDNTETNSHLKDRVRILEDILSKRKIQYFGCVPIIGEEEFVWNLKQVYKDKHEVFKSLHEAQKLESEAVILKQQAEMEMRNLKKDEEQLDETKTLLKWQNEKMALLKNEIQYKRKSDFKDMQLNHALQRIQMQDSQIIKLEEELLQLHSSFDLSFTEIKVIEAPAEKSKLLSPKPEVPKTVSYKMYNVQETQTDEIPEGQPLNNENIICSLRNELLTKTTEISVKEQTIHTLKSKITELEMNLSLFRKQIGDKQSQISFYEKHILELQSKKEDKSTSETDSDAPIVSLHRSNNNVENEIISLKNNVKSLQEAVTSKEQAILQLQSLLKQNRDNHSLAAARTQDEVRLLRKALNEEKQKYSEFQKAQTELQPNKAAIEQYILQVHSLEKHATELHTKLTCLESQLQASREEAVRWRSLSNDRLAIVEEVRKDLEERHRDEILTYKQDSEKWRDEVTNLKQMISKHRAEFGSIGSDVHRLLKEKDDKIHELTVMMRRNKSEVNKQRQTDKLDDETYSAMSEMEIAKEMLLKEHETLKKRFDTLLNREKSAREEVRELKGQLLKKPVSARTDKSERSIKDQMQKKINNLENEIEQLQTNLQTQISINETHKIKINEDFDKWKKQKQWQQTSEKLKSKLKEKEADIEKLQQTCNGFRLLIGRLEREKHNLENRIKNLKSIPAIPGSELIESLKLENLKLSADVDMLNSKLEIQHHHAGGLGAAMLQEKLEAQERKIAVLELTAKGTTEVRGEMERLHNNIISLQKNNIALEAEKLELKLDLEKSTKEMPYLRDQNQHLENYVEVLKNELDKEQLEKQVTPCTTNLETKKVSDLERTVFILKRVVEKLQVENKRLLSGKRPFTGSNDKLNRDFVRLKEQYCESVRKVSQLEQNLLVANNKIKVLEDSNASDNLTSLSQELDMVKYQSEQKTQLLDKVKILLHRAATKEKSLLEEIAALRIRA